MKNLKIEFLISDGALHLTNNPSMYKPLQEIVVFLYNSKEGNLDEIEKELSKGFLKIKFTLKKESSSLILRTNWSGTKELMSDFTTEEWENSTEQERAMVFAREYLLEKSMLVFNAEVKKNPVFAINKEDYKMYRPHSLEISLEDAKKKVLAEDYIGGRFMKQFFDCLEEVKKEYAPIKK